MCSTLPWAGERAIYEPIIEPSGNRAARRFHSCKRSRLRHSRNWGTCLTKSAVSREGPQDFDSSTDTRERSAAAVWGELRDRPTKEIAAQEIARQTESFPTPFQPMSCHSQEIRLRILLLFFPTGATFVSRLLLLYRLCSCEAVAGKNSRPFFVPVFSHKDAARDGRV